MARQRLPGLMRGIAVAVTAALTALGIAAQAPVTSTGRLTFARDVAPILFAHCASCHRPGQIAPFSLLTYEDARPRAAMIAAATLARTMPPWKPEPGFGEFVGANRLSDDEIDTLVRWRDEGAIQGNPNELPPVPTFPEGWRLGTPDLMVSLDAPYTLAGGGPDVLRNFVIPLPLDRARYVSGVEFRPGNASVVHHANMRLDRTRRARALDTADAAPGFDGRLNVGDFPEGHFLGWTPGQLPPRLADGMAWRLDPGTDLVLQLHMHPAQTSQQVQPSIGLFFTDVAPSRVPLMLRLGRQDIDMAAGDPHYHVEDRYVLPVDVAVTAVQPHAHYRARDVRGYALLPDGRRSWLIYIKDWDFNWQDVYRYAEPAMLPTGTTLVMEYEYDNSSSNRNNPDRPPKRIRWGQNSSDEMGDLWLQVVTRTAAERQRLRDDFGPKVMAEDAVGYETLLTGDPANARLHEAVAAIYLALNRLNPARDHLARALAIDGDSIEAHYNLGTALMLDRRLDEAMLHFERVLSLQPSHVGAHVNLGVALRRQNRYVEAGAHLDKALELDPDNAAAHTNLAGVLAATGHTREAIAHYRLAIESNSDLIEPLAELAWLLATASDKTLRQPVEAVRLAERAAQLKGGQSPRVMQVLAAARAAAAVR